MNLRSKIFEFYHNVVKRDELYANYEKIKKSQWLEPEELDQLQLDLLNKLIAHACLHTAYYREVFPDIEWKGEKPLDSKAALSNFPILTKDIIRARFEDLVAQNVDPRRRKLNTTSGSTGDPLKFYSDIGDQVTPALNLRFKDWMGVDHFCKKASVWGAFWDVSATKKLTATLKGWIKNFTVLSGYDLKEEKILSYFKFFRESKVELLISYPSILVELAKYTDRENQSFPHLKAIQTGGEKLFPHQREIIEKAFQTPVYDMYGARDMHFVAAECPEHQGLHIQSEQVLVEVLDDHGNIVQEGEGDLIITDLRNYVMPFIRYRIGDRAVIDRSSRCPCGRGLPLIKEVIGRSLDLVQLGNGTKVGGSFWTLLSRARPGIADMQIVQDSNGQICFRYTPSSEFSSATLDFIREEIYRKGGAETKLVFESYEKIPRNRAGKYRMVVSELNQT